MTISRFSISVLIGDCMRTLGRILHRELERRGRPHFLIGDPLLANELLVPALPWDYFKRVPILEGGMPMTIWAVINAVDTTALTRPTAKSRYRNDEAFERIDLECRSPRIDHDRAIAYVSYYTLLRRSKDRVACSSDIAPS